MRGRRDAVQQNKGGKGGGGGGGGCASRVVMWLGSHVEPMGFHSPLFSRFVSRMVCMSCVASCTTKAALSRGSEIGT